MPAASSSQTFSLRTLLRADFWRYLIQAGFLYFPAILFLLLAYFCFWKLTQGKDIMVITLEHRDTFAYFILALVYWSYVTWYSSRIVGKAKYFQKGNDHPVWTIFRVQGPRLLAFTCFTLIILSFMQLPSPYLPSWKESTCFVILLLSFPFYFLLYWLWTLLLEGVLKKRPALLPVLTRRIFAFLFVLVVAVIIFKRPWMLIALLLILQLMMVLLFIIRRKEIELQNASFYQQKPSERNFKQDSPVFTQLKGLVLDKEDKTYFRGFNLISAFAGIIYIATVVSVTFAVWLGSFPFALIAFAVLLGLGNFISTISILGRFNFHVLIVAVALLMGWLFEPHFTKLGTKDNAAVSFTRRQKLKEYFVNWVNERKAVLDSSDSYPVYFVLADGGASRSGYWTASVLSLLEDTTAGKFSQHLFCLSGASGGSVGNATFFSLLRSRDRLKNDTTASPYLNASRRYLASDFLTFALARMLGPDIFRYIFPLKNTYDRAAALAHALEHAPSKEQFLYDSLGVNFSGLCTQSGKPYSLPVFCINITRMQDGSPSIVSNINVADAYFNKRIDILNYLDTNQQDIKLSSAVVLGASFPYISPAGRIDFRYPQDSTIEPQYFVDGGYFDNSGSGIVYEMINGLWKMMKDSSNKALHPYRDKLKFQVLHITNETVGLPVMEKVHPLVNDLAAPLKTMIGSFGTQTSVNDLRLKGFMADHYSSPNHYIDLNLYRKNDTIRYSMNWVISDYLLRAMDKRLRNHENLNPLIAAMKNELK